MSKGTLRPLTAVIPAAGRGSRLGLSIPKVFVPLAEDRTIWDVIHEKVAAVAHVVVLVLSPEGEDYARRTQPKLFQANSRLKIAIQPEPRGMGDAVFGASSSWAGAEDLLIVWGDQFNLSPKTIAACVDLHQRHQHPRLTLPVVKMEQPYVEYIFDDCRRLIDIRQTREGDICQPGGSSDLGMFLLSGGRPLLASWDGYRKQNQAGSKTGEVNFLPFLSYLSTQKDWPVLRYEGAQPSEALGINTPFDLEHARKLFHQSRKGRDTSA